MPSDLAVQHTAAQAALRDRTGQVVARTWGLLGSWDTEDEDAFLALAIPVVIAARFAAVELTASFLAAFIGDDASVEAFDRDAVVDQLRGGAPLDTVYRRPFVTMRTALAGGSDFPTALDRGRQRAVGAVEGDLALAARDSAAVLTSIEPRVVGYRRVLGTGPHCGLCIVASTQRYHKGDLQPLHSRCSCSWEPIVGQRDPGRVIDKERLRTIQRLAREQGTGKLTRARYGRLRTDLDALPDGISGDGLPDVAVREHGELGPVLTDQHHDFTGPDDLVA